MRNASTALREAYIKMLMDGKKIATVAGAKVPVYDNFVNNIYAPEFNNSNKRPTSYWIISNINMIDRTLRQKFRADYTIQLDSFTTFQVGQGGQKLSEQLEDEAMQRIMRDQVAAFELTGFLCRETRLELSRPQNEFLRDYHLYRKITIFRHSIEEI